MNGTILRLRSKPHSFWVRCNHAVIVVFALVMLYAAVLYASPGHKLGTFILKGVEWVSGLLDAVSPPAGQ